MIYLGNTARYLRERKAMTQKVLADKLDITQVHLSNIENNKSLPSNDLLLRYRNVFGVDLYILAWCLHGDENDLPEKVREPMRRLAKAWRVELGDLVDVKKGA